MKKLFSSLLVFLPCYSSYYNDQDLKRKREEVLRTHICVETDNYILRKLEPKDANDLFEITSNPRAFELSRVIVQHTTREETEKYIADILAQYEKGTAPFLVGEGKRDQRVVGVIRLYGINHVDHKGILGYIINEEWWNKGVASEIVPAFVQWAFDELKLHRIEASAHPNNKASIRILEKLGMQLEGHARDYMLVNGQFEDRLLYGLLNPYDVMVKNNYEKE